MGQYVNPGNESFASAALYSQIYIDKTWMLEYMNRVINSEQRYLCVSRPRRFGKSITARMIAAYYSKGCDSFELFEGLRIAGSQNFKKHLNQYNVIQIDLAEMKVTMDQGENIVQYLQKSVIGELRDLFPGLVDDKASSLPLVLADINEKYGERFIIIIDEWDTIFREDKYNKKSQDEYIDLLRGLFKGEKSQRFMNLAYLTGILPIKRYNSESALNNFKEYTMASPKGLAEYVGFTQNEVQNLCEKYHMDFEEAKRWYDGYGFKSFSHIYCPNSVINAMLDGEYHNYWTGTVAYESLKLYITMDKDGLKNAITRLLAGDRYKVNIEAFENDMTKINSRDDVLTILIHLGYLAYDDSKKEAYIPNEEVRKAFTGAVEGTDWTPVIDAIKASDELLQATWNMDTDAVAKGIEESHMANASILKYNDENSLRCVIKLAYFNAINEYTVFDELPTGKGYADIVFLPLPYSDKPAMIVELKYDNSAEGAISQIKKKQYTGKLSAYKENILLVGINYSKEDGDKKHICVIEEWES